MKKLVLIAAMLFSSNAMAADEYLITIKDHKFSPANLEIPAGQKVKITVDNQDSTPEEFESPALHREKIVKGGGKIVVAIGPLKAGVYNYVGEFHEDSAKGTITAK